MKFAKKKDILIIAVIACVFLVLLAINNSDDEALVAIVEYNGEQIMELSIVNELETISMPHNENVILEYGSYGIKFVASDCPDKVCISSGLLTHSGEMAACLPNATIVRLQAESTDIVVG